MIGNIDNNDPDLDETVDEALDDDDLDDDPLDDDALDEDSDDDDAPDFGGDTLVDIAGELDVDDLVAKLDATDPKEIARRRAVRRRLEELREQRMQDLDSTFDFNLDDDP